MKHLLLLIAALFTLQLTAQTPAKKAQALRQKYASISASAWNRILTRSVPTHTLDSIVARGADGTFFESLEISYNDDGTASLMKQYVPDSLTGERILTSTIQFNYNGSEDPRNIVISFQNEETGVLEQQLIFDITYAAPGKADSIVISQQDPFGDEFIELLAYKYVYDGELIDETRDYFYFSFINAWLPSGITDYTYNGEDQLIEEVSTILDFETLELVPDTRTVYSYNSNDQVETATVYTYLNDTWDLSQRTNYTYFASGRIENEILQDYFNSEWVNNTWTRNYQSFVFDESDVTIYDWDAAGDVWVPVDSTHEVLNPNLLWEDVYTPSQLSIIQTDDFFFFPFLGEGSSTLVESHYVVFDEESGEPILLNINTNYYSLIGSSKVETVLPDYISVTPNPATEYFNITLGHETASSYMITSVNGQRIAFGKLQLGNNRIDTNTIAPGIYMVLITTADGTTYAHRQIVK